MYSQRRVQFVIFTGQLQPQNFMADFTFPSSLSFLKREIILKFK
ncbi:hypothetical protein i14_4351 [Escherichia coli str. 'clone D i14']|uniref:Uncharacterized protein n=1 Tax=Escherichia coli O6:H1 (strain CFT073 / ATCC 700928 / UPEC) TaxID=199310 RepID=A0A0H2VCX8_ECOL6|nr:Hypothetical protein c4756 [Escherichia coli CFT073]AER86872.1 hypothetical protein i02_4351 [Escherichia coli str. 'clone D i2']AER91791.1 hypothetical protein i14_4351 [Escherichia coli str. 'clone D i14']EEJ44883.1 hypothetical protein HMPREF0358_5170 [Escherichia coli 83972]KEL98015.1 hypothetical protein AC62_4526 [Escherichia coli 6-175-07_S3_C3]KEM18926.1 hypothetical protein AC10_4405 [Escherichia coli 6-319-05_S3_C1]